MRTMDLVLAATHLLLAVVVPFSADMLIGTWRRRRRGFARRRAERELMARVIDALASRDEVEHAAKAMRTADHAVAATVCLAAGRIVAEEQRAVLARLARAAQAPLTTIGALGLRVVLPLDGFLHDGASEVRAAAIRARGDDDADRFPRRLNSVDRPCGRFGIGRPHLFRSCVHGRYGG